MSGGDWGERIATGLGVTTFVGITFWIAVDLTALRTEQRVSEYYASQYEASDTDQEIAELCSLRPDAARMECLIEQIQAREQWGKDRRDLHAQEWMARWAAWMFGASALAAIAAIVGLWLLRRTWVEAKRTAEITRKIGEAQVRAYLAIKVKNTSSFEAGLFPKVEIYVENTGQSPAHAVSRKCLVKVLDAPMKVPDEAWALTPDENTSTPIVQGHPQIVITTPNSAITESQINSIRSGQSVIGIFMVVHYKSVFGTDHVERHGFCAIAPDSDTLIKWTSNHLGRDLLIEYRIIEEYSKSD